MKRILLAVSLAVISSGAVWAQSSETRGSATAGNKTAVSKQGRQVDLQSDTQLAAQLENTLDARNAKVGDRVLLKTTEAIKQNGEVVVPKGARLLGHVSEVQQRTKSNGESRLGIVFDRLQKGSLDIPITASIVSLTQARSRAQANDSSLDSDLMSSSSSSARSSRSAPANGGLLGGVGSTVGGVVNSTSSTVGNVAGSTTNAVGSTVGSTTSNLGGTLKGLQINQSGSASAQGGSTLSLGSGNLRLESGTTFNLMVSESASSARNP